jgi:hypothetical protein
MSSVEIIGRVEYRHMANHRDIPLCSRLRPPVGGRPDGDQASMGRWVSLRAPPYRRSGLCRPATGRGDTFTPALDQNGTLQAAGAPDGGLCSV